MLRPGTRERGHLLGVISRLASMLETMDPLKQLWVVEEDRVRIRE